MPRPLDPGKRQAILDAIRNGAGTRSRNQIARQFGVAGRTITKVAQDEGLGDVWDRSLTKRATAARSADTAAKLAEQAYRNALVAERILDSFEAMTREEWARVPAHSRGIILAILQDKVLLLAASTDDGQEQRRAILAELLDLMRETATQPAAAS